MDKFFLIFILLLFATGCGNKEYWPLERGNYWEYGMRMKGNLIVAATRYEVLSVKESGGEKTAELEVKDAASGQLQSRFTLVSSDKGVYETNRTAFVQTTTGYNENYSEYMSAAGIPYLIVADAKPGSRWNFDYTLRDHAAGADVVIKGSAVAETMQGFNMPAGHFKTIKIVYAIQRGNTQSPEQRIHWFKRGLGPVKMEWRTPVGDSILILQKARVGRKTYGKKD